MRPKDLSIIAIFTFVTAVAWIILSLYHTKVTSTISPALQKQIEPISPRFDKTTIDRLKKQRKKLEVLTEIVSTSGGQL